MNTNCATGRALSMATIFLMFAQVGRGSQSDLPHPQNRPARPKSGIDRPADNVVSGIPNSYCGIYALYRALAAEGKVIRFADLVRPEYIGSRKGSKMAELIRAGQDFGMYVEPMQRMNCAMLRQAHCSGRFCETWKRPDCFSSDPVSISEIVNEECRRAV
jgi:hypothetical protein